MNHLALNFDLNWFLTIPGLLITGGVLLLLIALIIFIATSGKGKNESTLIEPVDSENSFEQSMVVNTPINDESVNIPVNEVEEVKPDIENNVNEINPNQEININKSQSSEEVKPFNEEVNSLPEENVAIPQVNLEKTKEELMPNEVLEQPKGQAEIKEEKVSIYGGVSPIIPNINQNVMNQSHQIYGGANPLDKTQSIPIVNENNVYKASNPEEKIEEVKVVADNNDVVDNLANFQPTIETPIPFAKEEIPQVAPAVELESENSSLENKNMVEEKKEEEVEVLDF